MSLRTYVYIWLLLTLILGYECYCLNRMGAFSLLHQIRAHTLHLKNLNLSPEAGKPISWYLGIAGFTVLLLTNPYIIRKRFSVFKNIGTLSHWLSFHIFCGLLGPTLILFHTNFKVGGLVAISFWSMVISFLSGIVGRYFYVQLLQHGAWLNQRVEKCEARLGEYRSQTEKVFDESVMEEMKKKALALVGASKGEKVRISTALFRSMVGDIRLLFQDPEVAPGFPEQGRYVLREYALTRRRIDYAGVFQNLMGYWHSFHTPFAVFMYLVAVIHIIVAVLFRSSL